VTVNVPVALLPTASVAEQVTVVASGAFLPFGNSEPDGGVHENVTGPGRLSVAVAEYATTFPAVWSA